MHLMVVFMMLLSSSVLRVFPKRVRVKYLNFTRIDKRTGRYSWRILRESRIALCVLFVFLARSVCCVLSAPRWA